MAETETKTAVVRRRQTLVGTVVSTKMTQTVSVSVVRRTAHPVYKRSVKKTRRFLAHDETSQCRVGDEVKIVETRPISRRKRWRVSQIINRSELNG